MPRPRTSGETPRCWVTWERRPCKAVYYLWDYTSAELYTVNAATGVLAAVGPSGLSVDISGLAFDANHRLLYGSDTASLYTFNMTSGAATLLGSLSSTIAYGMTYDPVDNMLYSVNATGDPGAD